MSYESAARNLLAEEQSPVRKKPNLIVDSGDLPATARALCDFLAQSGRLFDRGVPVKIVASPDSRVPTAIRLTPNRVVFEAHRICRPSKPVCDELEPVTLPDRVARMYLEMDGEWHLPPLAGICAAPLLSANGRVRTATGYDPATRLWCTNLPTLRMPDHPSRAEAEAGLRLLRETFRTFPFADAERRIEAGLGTEVVNLDQRPGKDESTFLVGLLTAICRPSRLARTWLLG